MLRFRIYIVINPCKCLFRNLCKFRQKICETFCIKCANYLEYSLVYLHLSQMWWLRFCCHTVLYNVYINWLFGLVLTRNVLKITWIPGKKTSQSWLTLAKRSIWKALVYLIYLAQKPDIFWGSDYFRDILITQNQSSILRNSGYIDWEEKREWEDTVVMNPVCTETKEEQKLGKIFNHGTPASLMEAVLISMATIIL